MTTTIVNPNSSNSAHRPLAADYKLHWYQIKSVLGRGGFGITYLADDLNLQKQVAIKEFFPTEFAFRESGETVLPASDEAKATYEWGLERFISEARTLSKFEHPNIVKVHAVFEENGTGYMVMSYEQGDSLQSMLEGGQVLSESVLLNALHPLLDGLQLVHEHKFIHRDIKPDNVFIRTDGTPVLLDFGSARQSLAGESADMTVLVTPGYAPVEQYFSNSDNQGPWTDIYGLGATLYRAVTGELLTNAVERSHSERSDSTQVRGSVEHAAKLRAARGYSAQFLDAIERAIKVDAADRPQTVAEWRSEVPAVASAAQPLVTPLSQVGSQDSPKSRGVGVLLLGALAAVSIFGGGYGYLTYQEQSQPESVQQSVTEPDATEPPETAPSGQAEGVGAKDLDVKEVAQPVTQPIQDTKSAEDALLEEKRLEENRLETARLEKARLELIAQQTAIEEQRKRDELAQAKRQKEAQRLKKAEQLRAAEVERKLNAKIEASAAIISARSGKTPDTLEYLGGSAHTDLSDLSGQKLTTTVMASTNEWQDSGVMLERGSTYRVTATGSWKMAPICRKIDASGQGMYRRLCVDLNIEVIKRYSLGALIAKIGQQPLPFYIGEEFEFTSNEDAPLFLRSNDAPNQTGNNTGSLEVSITKIQ